MKLRWLVIGVMASVMLAGCGKATEESNVITSKMNSQSDITQEYEIEWVDTSELALVDDMNGCKTDSSLYFLQSELESIEKDGRMKHVYSEMKYDMLEKKWTKTELPEITAKINEIGIARSFQRDKDGNWYCYLGRWDKESKGYRNAALAKIEGDTIDYVELPEDIWGDGYECVSYFVMEDGCIMFKIGEAGKEIAPESMKCVVYNPDTDEVESTGDMMLGFSDYLRVEDEYFYQSVTNTDCGFKVKKSGSDDVIREINCDGKVSEAGWAIDGEVYSIQEDDMLYMMNQGGIYGGNSKEAVLKKYVEPSFLEELNLDDESSNRFINQFWQGEDENNKDFYILLGEYSDEDSEEHKITLAHVKRKE